MGKMLEGKKSTYLPHRSVVNEMIIDKAYWIDLSEEDGGFETIKQQHQGEPRQTIHKKITFAENVRDHARKYRCHIIQSITLHPALWPKESPVFYSSTNP